MHENQSDPLGGEEAKRPLTLADIVDTIELPKPAVHRILQQLQENRLIARSNGGTPCHSEGSG